jgi:hypothetical protein
MKPEMRQQLARRSFEEKIRKVSDLIRLSRKTKTQRVRENSSNHPQSGLSATAKDPQSVELPPRNSK